MIKIGILGAAGYTGGELIRLLINHPQAEIVFANSGATQAILLLMFTKDFTATRICASRRICRLIR